MDVVDNVSVYGVLEIGILKSNGLRERGVACTGCKMQDALCIAERRRKRFRLHHGVSDNRRVENFDDVRVSIHISAIRDGRMADSMHVT